MKNESGRSMIEMLGVLAIIGVLSVGGIAGYSKAMEKFKINKTINQISHIVANTHTLFMGQKGYNGLNTTVAHNAGIIPEEMWKNDDAYNVYGGRVEMFGTSYIHSNYANDSAFILGFENISKEACIALASYDWRQMNAYSCIVGEWIFGEFVEMMVDIAGADFLGDERSECKWEQEGVKGYGVYWQCFGDGDAPLSPADAAAACNNEYEYGTGYHMVCSFY